MFLMCVAIIDENSKKALKFFCFPQVVVGYLIGFKKPKLPLKNGALFPYLKQLFSLCVFI